MILFRRLLRQLVLFPLLCVGSCGAAEGNVVDGGIHKFVETYFGSWSRADFSVYRSLFHSSASVTVLEGEQWRPWDLSTFLNDQERVQSQQKMEEIPLSIDVKASENRSAFVEVAWQLNRTPQSPPVTGKDWFTLVKEGEAWKILNLTFWQDASPKLPRDARAPAGGAAKPKIVVSGFEQFAGRSINASSEIAQAIVKAFPQWDITFVHVPVLWGAPKQAIARARSLKPTIWIAFGEGTSAFQIETVARNTRGQHKDNKSEMPLETEITPKGVQQLKLDFPAEALSDRLRRLGYDFTSSSDAGKYLCEEMLYSLLEETKASDATLKHGLFIHVPVHAATVRVRGKEVPLKDENLRVAARDLFEAIATVLEISVPK